jgi:hypothetical protein
MNIGPKENKVVINVDFTKEELQVLDQASKLVCTLLAVVTHSCQTEQIQFVIQYGDGGTSTCSVSELSSTAIVLDGFEGCEGNETFYIEALLDNEPIE